MCSFPFRGRALTTLLATVSPMAHSYDETNSTLTFARRAMWGRVVEANSNLVRSVKNRASVNTIAAGGVGMTNAS